METVLSISIACFLILMCLWLLEAIIQGIFYLIYQRTGRLFLSVVARYKISVSHFSLEHKGEIVDTAFAYTKHKRYYYVLGLNGIYKIGFVKFIKLAEADLTKSELNIVREMRKECYARVLNEKDMLDLFVQRNTELPDNAE